jgi:hypothetical protein
MAHSGQDDPRPMVSYVSDCDPAAWQMPVSIARKLQAFIFLIWNSRSGMLLHPDRVRELRLPVSP